MSDNMNMAELMAVVTSIPGTAAAEAVEAAHLAQEVKESIPADYSELSADVAEIKGAYAAKTDTVLETTLSRGRKAGTTAGSGSLAFGSNVEASNNYSVAFGINAKATGMASYAEGGLTQSGGSASHAEGASTVANGGQSHAEGFGTSAYGNFSHTEGNSTIANGSSSHVEGSFNIADSHASWPEWVASTSYVVGNKVKVTTTSGEDTVVTGYICKTDNSDAEFTASHWAKDDRMNFTHITGNGTADNARSNAYALDWDGNGHYMGDVYVGCNADSSGGTKLVKDVQVNGTSVVSDGVADVPVANGNDFGVVKVGATLTINSSGFLSVDRANAAVIKEGTDSKKLISASLAYASTFYGLAKAADDTTQSQSSNPIGTYTADAIDKILAMLGVIDMVAPHEASSTASKAYEVGDAFIYAGKLYKVTDDIASGGTITPDTNCTQTTLVELMKG